MSLRDCVSLRDCLFLSLGLLAAACYVLAVQFLAPGEVRAVLRWGAAVLAVWFITGHDDATRSVARGALLGLGLVGLAFLARTAVQNFLEPHTWDFFAWYLYGTVAAAGQNIYDPAAFSASFAHLVQLLPVDPDFEEEVVGVGFPYPPPTILLFYPLGLLSFDAAHLSWICFLALTAMLAILAIARLLAPVMDRFAALLIAIAFVALWPASLINAYFEQTNWLLLALAIALVASTSDASRGVLAALAVMVKPLLVVAPLFLMLRGQFRAMVISLLTGIGATLVALALLGPELLFDYFLNGPAGRVPHWQYSQGVNQSLLAVALRSTRDAADPLLTTPVAYWPYLIAAIVVFAISAFALVRVWRGSADYAFSILVAAALLVYPGTLTHYSVLLLLPLVVMLRRTWPDARARAGTLGVAALLAGITLLSFFLANLACWVWLCWSALASKDSGRFGDRVAD